VIGTTAHREKGLASRGLFLLLSVVAALLIIAAYANSLHNEFHFDDSHVIVNNAYIRNLRNIPSFFTDAHAFSSLPQNSTYRPLVSLSFAIDYAAGHGLDPVAFHVTQIGLLIAVWAMLIPFYRRVLDLAAPASVNRLLALAAATLFAVHTANTETMNFISCRSELISTLGLLGAFLLIQRSPVARRYHLYLLLIALGALAKAPVVVFAPLLTCYVFLFSESARSWRLAFRAALPALVTGVLLLLSLNSMNAKEWTSGGGSTLQYALTQPFVWFHYARLFLLPAGLTADTDWTLFEHWYDTRAIVGFVFVIALVAVIRRLSKTRQTTPIAFGLAWFGIALIPTSSFFPLAEVANEHRIFFPYIGLTLAAVYGACMATRSLEQRARDAASPEFPDRRIDPTTGRAPASSHRIEIAAALLLVIIILAHAIGTHARNKVWRTEESLWKDTAEKSPENGRALMNFGLTQMAQGRYAVAKLYFERAQLRNPAYSTLQINLGIVDGALGLHDAAEGHFREALRLKDDADGHLYYGRWLSQNGRGPEAVAHVARAIALAPGSAPGRSLMMYLDAARGALAQLRDVARESLSIDPRDAEAQAFASGRAPFRVATDDYAGWFNDGIVRTSRGDDLDAAISYRQALRFSPRSSDALNNLGYSLGRLGFRNEARESLLRALTARPDFPLAENNLRWVESLK
jgi:protein O-mannosyl-transferase